MDGEMEDGLKPWKSASMFAAMFGDSLICFKLS